MAAEAPTSCTTRRTLQLSPSKCGLFCNVLYYHSLVTGLPQRNALTLPRKPVTFVGYVKTWWPVVLGCLAFEVDPAPCLVQPPPSNPTNSKATGESQLMQSCPKPSTKEMCSKLQQGLLYDIGTIPELRHFGSPGKFSRRCSGPPAGPQPRASCIT